EIILEPIKMAGDRVNNLEILVDINGGGSVGQAQAARTAIAKGIVAFTKDDELKNIYLDYDRFLLVPDPRRVEPKKFKGRKARARFQKSYR
ncbi:MAG: 30S ribosomal protein S9, partial [Candidatus Micrarchaeia archaeon]